MKNTFVKVLSFVMALTMIVGAFSMTVSAADCTHENSEVVTKVEATCVNAGYTVYKCTDCGENYIADRVAQSKEHTGITEIPATEATCVAPAYSAGSYCADCMVNAKGEPVEYIVAPQVVTGSVALGHVFKGVAGDCFYTNKHVCATCGKSPEELGIKADDEKYGMFVAESTGHGHNYEVVLEKVPGTCVDGLVVATCKDCGHSDDYTVYGTHNKEYYKACDKYVGWFCKDCGYSYVSDTKDDDEIVHQGVVQTAINAELQNLNYTKETLSLAPDCENDGYVVKKCAVCGLVYREVIEALGHDWTLGEKANENDEACEAGKTVFFYCARKELECEAVDVVIATEDKGHLYTTTVKEPTCTAEGYTKDKCLVCGDIKVYNYTAKVAHTAGNAVESYNIAAGVDHSKDYTVTVACTECGDIISSENKVPATGDHVYSATSSLTIANCSNPSYFVKVCTVGNCGAFIYVNESGIEVSAADKVGIGDKDPSIHDVASATPLSAKAATCSAEGWVKYWCNTCKVEFTVPTEKLAHTWGNTFDANKDGDLKDAGDKDWTGYAATCTKPGQTKGWLCTVCGEVKAEPQLIAINEKNHVNANGAAVTGVKTDSKAATCRSAATETYYYSCCGKYIVTYLDGGFDFTNHVKANQETVKYKAATCTENGNHKYTVCKDCGEITIAADCECGADHTGLTFPFIPTTKYNHMKEVEKVIAKVYETCTEAGTEKITVYTCGCKVGGETIPAHGNKYAITESAATCFAKGYKFTEAAAEKAYVCKYCDTDCFVELPKLSHNNVLIEVEQGGDCTAPTFDTYDCAYCHTIVVKNYKAATNTEHKYNVNWLKFLVDEKTGAVSMLDKNGNVVAVPEKIGGGHICDTTTFEYRYCVVPGCEHFEIKEGTEKAPVAHKAGETVLSYNCGDIANFVGKKCDTCGVEITEEAIKAGTIVKHNVIKLEQKATCTEDGYYVEVCSDCGKEFKNVVTAKKGHNKKYTIEIVPATIATPGYEKFVCTVCGEVTEVIPALAGLGATVTYSNAAVQNGTVTVQIAVSATEFKFNSLVFDLAVSNDLTLVNSELAYGFAAADAVNMIAKQNNGKVTVKVYVANVTAGVAANAVITGDKVAFINLTFKVAPTATAATLVSGLTATEYAVVEEGKLTDKEIVVTTAMKALTLQAAADVSGNAVIDNGDHIAMLNLIYSGEYAAAADLNNDGVVDIDDHYALVNYLVSDKSEVAYLEMLGVNAATLVANYNNRYDFNADGLVNDSDAAFLEVAVAEALNAAETLAGVDLNALVATVATALFNK